MEGKHSREDLVLYMDLALQCDRFDEMAGYATQLAKNESQEPS
jgi:hypothetical protein